MRCPACGETLSSGASTCPSCGLPLASRGDADGRGADYYYRELPARFLNAADSGDSDVLTACLSEGVDIDVRDTDGRTALMRAIYYDEPRNARILLDRGASPHARDNDGESPLIYAARGGDAGSFDALLDHGARTDVFDVNGGRLFDVLLESDCTKALRSLIDHGWDPESWEAHDEAERTPLARAAEDGNAEFVRILLEAGANPNNLDYAEKTPLYAAADYGHLQIAELLLRAGAEPDFDDMEGDTPLMRTCIADADLDLIKLLVENGADPDRRNCADMRAVDYADGRVKRYLLRHTTPED